jgi:UDP-N-acetyl-2-amino-2-deoxyglucuronate dehydrogenase
MYRIGIIGAGWVSSEHIRAYMGNPETEIVAIAVRREESATAQMAEHGFTAQVYTDVAKMLNEANLDIVSICTPPSMHPEHTIAAAQAGCHLVIEKPVALDLAALRDIQSAVKKAQVKTVVSFVLRWNPLFETINALLSKDAIGDVFYAEIDYQHGIGPWYGQYAWNRTKAEGGSSLLSAGIHAVDGLRWFMGAEPVEVQAYSTNSHNTDHYPGGYEYDPTIVAIMKFANGAIGKVGSTIECLHPYTFPITLMGTDGSIRDNKLFAKSLMPGQTGYATIPTILPDSGDVTHHPFQDEINHLVDCINRGVESHTNLDDAVKTHEICYAAQQAADEGRAITLPLA